MPYLILIIYLAVAFALQFLTGNIPFSFLAFPLNLILALIWASIMVSVWKMRRKSLFVEFIKNLIEFNNLCLCHFCVKPSRNRHFRPKGTGFDLDICSCHAVFPDCSSLRDSKRLACPDCDGGENRCCKMAFRVESRRYSSGSFFCFLGSSGYGSTKNKGHT